PFRVLSLTELKQGTVVSMALFHQLPGIGSAPHAVAAISVNQLHGRSALAHAELVEPALARRCTTAIQTMAAAAVLYLEGTADTGHTKLMNRLKWSAHRSFPVSAIS